MEDINLIGKVPRALSVVLLIVFLMSGPGESSDSFDQLQRANEISGENIYMPLDFGPGFGATWFGSRSLNTDVTRIENPQYGLSGALRISFLASKNQQRIDHVPIYLEGGNYIVTFRAFCDRPGQWIFLKLIKMECDSNGDFSNVIAKRLKIHGNAQKRYVVNLTAVRKGFYIIRLSVADYPKDSKLDLYDFYIYPFGSGPKKRLAQIAPDIDSVVYKIGNQVRIGARIYLTTSEEFDLKYEIRTSDDALVKDGSLGKFKGPGYFTPSTRLTPEDYEYYVVTYTLEGNERQLTQKAFSVLPEGDSSFMGLHCNGIERATELLKLGRKIGFTRYRDHDFGAFTRWSRVQPGDGATFSPENPPPYQWIGKKDIKFIVEQLGYDYLGVLFQTPEWAKDPTRSRVDHPVGVPVIRRWRDYVREVVKRYTFEQKLVHEWEIWNEGKGITGYELDDSTTYILLLETALAEIKKLESEHSSKQLKIVAFGGINHEKIWKEVLATVRGFNVVSSHWKATRYRDTYFPAKRPNRVSDARYTRDGWLTRAMNLIRQYSIPVEHWDTECGLLNQVLPIYNFYQIPGRLERHGMPLADRRADEKFQTEWLSGILKPLEAAAIMTKQVVAHKSAGLTRCYMYHFSKRDFVNPKYPEQMLEYDGTLMPYTHAYVFASKMLDNMKYESRSSIDSTSIIRERFISDSGHVIDVLWNEGKSPAHVRVARDVEVCSMMGKKLRIRPDQLVAINEYPLYFISEHP